MSSQGIQQPDPGQAVPQIKMGQYTLLEKIAQGGMAQVFKAKTVDPTGIERLVVIKRILPHISSQPEYVEMLVDEAKIAVHFTHGNIAQVYDLGRMGDDYFIVMEYVDGHTYSQINKTLQERHQKIPLDILLFCFIELCHGLSYIHRKTGPSGKPLGVVHRDISPQNIILSYAGNVKIIDFGVARADFLESKTEHGVLKGKFAYMSPEQTRGEKIDNRSDIFSVGTLLWEMATGERLFKRGSNPETVKAVQRAKFDLPSERRGDIPKSLDRIVRKALSRNPRSRYNDAADMALELEKLLFSINPDFRPVAAAKFLYDLFGPEKDEAGLPPPFFVKAPPVEEKAKTHKSSISKVLRAQVDNSPPSPPPAASDDEPTVKEHLGDEITPVVRMPRFRRFRTSSWLITFGILILFFLGTLFTLVIHQLNKRAYVQFSGQAPGMHLFINGKPAEFPKGELTVASGVPHEIRVTRQGYKDYIHQIVPGPREHVKIPLRMEKAIPPFGDLTIETSPPGATVFVDGKEQGGKTPLTIKNLAHAQKYKINMSLPGHKPVENEVEVVGGKELKISTALSIDFAVFQVASEPPGAEVFMDDSKIGITPLTLEQILPGVERRIRVILPGYQPAEQQILFNPGESRQWNVTLTPEPPADTAAGDVPAAGGQTAPLSQNPPEPGVTTSPPPLPEPAPAPSPQS